MIYQRRKCSNISNKNGDKVSNYTNFASDWIISSRMRFPHNAFVETAESFRTDVSRSKVSRKLKTGLSNVHSDHKMRLNPSCDISTMVSIWNGFFD